ncbi:bifunctional metallophosphatase/5'-nucleotidase [Nakamurella deserti]|uniref:bifunctional metallophosphatase/5'-nucleotidase n=1 Tax=Nakamurella deserti TaxID=2164074 RepID=UPI00197B22D9|nr:bifunctional UDP-sugar hydrolase/5'-nucleotidase [Nakamurella deserti]
MTDSHRWRRLAGGAAVSALAAGSLTVGVTLPAHALTPTVINLLSINDFHGRINDATVDFAETVEKLRQDALIANDGVDNTLLVGAGDLIGASDFASAVAQDQPTIDVMNALGMATSSVGNHEFDQGFADLTDRVIADGTNASWEYLGANVYEKGTTTPALPEYSVTTVNGLEVAVIGVVTQETPTLVSPAGIATLDFGDPVAAINRVADQLTDGDPANGEADVLVASVHEGAPAGENAGATLESQVAASAVFSSIVNGTSAKVAAILNGHTHQTYAWDGSVPGGDGATRPIIQTGNYGDNVGQIQLTVDADTNAVLSYTVGNVAAQEDVTFDPELGTPASIGEITGIVDAALAYAEEVGSQPVGSVTADITTAFSGGTYGPDGYGGEAATRDNRGAESSLGNLVADALLDSMSSEERGAAEISLVNPGGLRAELLRGDDGVITYAEANAVLPFVNNLFTTDLTGTQLLAVLEQQWQTVVNAETGAVEVPSRPYLQLGLSDNMSYTFDPDPDGDGVTVGDLDDQGRHIRTVVVNGEPVTADAVYRVGSFSFLLQGGDNFTAFADGTDTRDSGLIDRDAWIAYLQANPGLAPEFDKHAVAVTGLADLPGPGGTTTLTVGSLDLTSLGAPANTSLATRLLALPEGGGEPVATDLGSVPVQGGAATVPFTVPAAGAYYLEMTAAPSNTVVTVPILVLGEQTTPPSTTTTPTTATSTTATSTSTTAPVAATTTKSTAKPTTKPGKGQLASTGISDEDTTTATLLATLLIALGAGLVIAGRRRELPGRHQG